MSNSDIFKYEVKLDVFINYGVSIFMQVTVTLKIRSLRP